MKKKMVGAARSVVNASTVAARFDAFKTASISWEIQVPTSKALEGYFSSDSRPNPYIPSWARKKLRYGWNLKMIVL